MEAVLIGAVEDAVEPVEIGVVSVVSVLDDDVPSLDDDEVPGSASVLDAVDPELVVGSVHVCVVLAVLQLQMLPVDVYVELDDEEIGAVDENWIPLDEVVLGK